MSFQRLGVVTNSHAADSTEVEKITQGEIAAVLQSLDDDIKRFHNEEQE